MSMFVPFRKQVNGSLLAQNMGQKISIFGKVIKVNPNGVSFDIQSGDDMVVTIFLGTGPVSEPVSGLVEVKGVVQGRNSVMCEDYITFPTELANTFDAALDNEAVMLCNSVANPWR